MSVTKRVVLTDAALLRLARPIRSGAPRHGTDGRRVRDCLSCCLRGRKPVAATRQSSDPPVGSLERIRICRVLAPRGTVKVSLPDGRLGSRRLRDLLRRSRPRPRHTAQNPLRPNTHFARAFSLMTGFSAPVARFLFRFSRIRALFTASCFTGKGRFAVVTRREVGMRWPRGLAACP